MSAPRGGSKSLLRGGLESPLQEDWQSLLGVGSGPPLHPGIEHQVPQGTWRRYCRTH